jgi:hypothetical protein
MSTPPLYSSLAIRSGLTPEQVDWPGWRLIDNPFWREFDFDARKRMILGSAKLLPYIEHIKNSKGKHILEIGPFFNPLVTPETFPGHHILYWENDPYVCKFLKEFFWEKVDIFSCDLGIYNENKTIELWGDLSKVLNQEHPEFEYVIMSHVLNYVDYRSLFIQLKHFLPKGATIFINHVVDYWIPKFFNHKRPKSSKELIDTLEKLWFMIEKDDDVEDDFKYHGVYKGRHIIVARVK